MTAPSNPLGDEWRRTLACRAARRTSRQFAGMGVGIPAVRLREIASGAPVDTDEWVDVIFGLTASEIKHEQRVATFARARRRGMHWLIVAGMVVVGLNMLVCMALALFMLTQHVSPY